MINNKSGDPITLAKTTQTLISPSGMIVGGIELICEAKDKGSDLAHLRREYRYLEDNLRKWKKLLEVGVALTSSLSLHRVLLRMVKILSDTFSYENIVILLPSQDDELEVWAR